jgi:hypothetical protein
MYECYRPQGMTSGDTKARRRSVDTEPLIAQVGGYDYADSFEIDLREPDERAPEQWMRAAIGGAHIAVKTTVGVAWRYLLRFELDSRAPRQLFGMPILESTRDVAYMSAGSPLLVGHLIGRREDDTRISLTTALIYKQRRLAAAVWATAGPAHRRIAPYLLERVANEDA